MINADSFKPNINGLTEFRIKQILRYVIYCYLQIRKDVKTYDYSKKGRVSKEDFLKNGLVNDYLQKNHNKEYFKQHISDNPSVEITFHPEETMAYIGASTNERSTDKIDIAIWENILQHIWSGETDNEIKFAIECKRIEKPSDSNKYVSDINNFCTRNYIYTRLPFEGQIAFIENSKINHINLSTKINEDLEGHQTIVTNSLLNQIMLSDTFKGTYLSKHQRITTDGFSIYHLLLDYSDIVVKS